jgi:uncharacterized protein YbgA (DUF1722 family)/uncharacterized protein YbbK (DUF523 family)
MKKSGCTPRLGISTCLLGRNVRYDGGHKHDRFLTDVLGPNVEWVPVCPEVECGLPVPRESMRLVGAPDAPRLVTVKTGIDHTQRMLGWARGRLDELAKEKLNGFIFKKGSPSSGRFRVKVYNDEGIPSPIGIGLFARAFTERFPSLPVEEEGRLNDPLLRENFIERVFLSCRWQALQEQEPTPGGLVRFHTSVKLTVMAHSITHYQELGRMVARAGERPWEEMSSEYLHKLTEAMQIIASPGRHINVMQHLMGFVKGSMNSGDKEELLSVMEDYRNGLTPLIVPLTLLKHHLRRHNAPDWVFLQDYLYPFPKELMLRNHA